MSADQILIDDLGLDAMQFMEHVISHMPLDSRVQAIQALSVGGMKAEVRVRLSVSHDPRISFVLIGNASEVELVALGGRPREVGE